MNQSEDGSAIKCIICVPDGAISPLFILCRSAVWEKLQTINPTNYLFSEH